MRLCSVTFFLGYPAPVGVILLPGPEQALTAPLAEGPQCVARIATGEQPHAGVLLAAKRVLEQAAQALAQHPFGGRDGLPRGRVEAARKLRDARVELGGWDDLEDEPVRASPCRIEEGSGKQELPGGRLAEQLGQEKCAGG